MSAADTNPKPYTLIGQPVHRNDWIAAQDAVVPGWAVRAQWRGDKGIITVFVPDKPGWSADADIAIRQQGAELDALQSAARQG